MIRTGVFASLGVVLCIAPWVAVRAYLLFALMREATGRWAGTDSGSWGPRFQRIYLHADEEVQAWMDSAYAWPGARSIARPMLEQVTVSVLLVVIGSLVCVRWLPGLLNKSVRRRSCVAMFQVGSTDAKFRAARSILGSTRTEQRLFLWVIPGYLIAASLLIWTLWARDLRGIESTPWAVASGVAAWAVTVFIASWAATAFGVWEIRRLQRGRFPRKDGRAQTDQEITSMICAECGYPLDLTTSGQCPECGISAAIWRPLSWPAINVPRLAAVVFGVMLIAACGQIVSPSLSIFPVSMGNAGVGSATDREFQLRLYVSEGAGGAHVRWEDGTVNEFVFCRAAAREADGTFSANASLLAGACRWIKTGAEEQDVQIFRPIDEKHRGESIGWSEPSGKGVSMTCFDFSITASLPVIEKAVATSSTIWLDTDGSHATDRSVESGHGARFVPVVRVKPIAKPAFLSQELRGVAGSAVTSNAAEDAPLADDADLHRDALWLQLLAGIRAQGLEPVLRDRDGSLTPILADLPRVQTASSSAVHGSNR